MSNIFLLLIYCSIAVQCVDIEKEIYYEIPVKSVSHCVRRLNLTSTIGCSSKSNGNVGIIEIAFNESELNHRLDSLKEDTILIINTELFINRNITNRLLTNVFINGLIIFEQENCNYSNCKSQYTPHSFSEDYKNPNQMYSIYDDKVYNPPGTEYAFKNWPFPMALIGKRYKDEQDKILSCYYQYNVNTVSNRKCALEIKNFMAAIKSAATCLLYEEIQNRFAGLFHYVSFCEDFTGMNYAIHTKQTVETRPPDSVIVLMSRIDSLSIFEKSAVNIHGALTSVSLLISVMGLLMSQPEFKTGKDLVKDVVFLFLDNESYDYLGANRFLIDLKSRNIAKSSGSPIEFSHLDLLLEFGELGFANFSDAVFHYPRFASAKERNKTQYYLGRLAEFYGNFGFQANYSVENLPPSSVQYLLRSKSMPAIVMSDHQEQFRNSFYNSFLDSKRMANNSNELIAIVNAVASFVFQEATGKNLSQLMHQTDLFTPSNIIECFSENIRCDLLKKVLTSKIIDNLYSLGTPIPTQAHSASKDISSDYRLSYLLSNLLVYLSGQEVNNSVCKACPKCANLTTIDTGNDTRKCYVTRIVVSDEFSFTAHNGSMWVTSKIVDRQSIRMFVKAPNTPLLITGIVMTISMTLFMILVSSRMAEIFHCDL